MSQSPSIFKYDPLKGSETFNKLFALQIKSCSNNTVATERVLKHSIESTDIDYFTCFNTTCFIVREGLFINNFCSFTQPILLAKLSKSTPSQLFLIKYIAGFAPLFLESSQVPKNPESEPLLFTKDEIFNFLVQVKVQASHFSSDFLPSYLIHYLMACNCTSYKGVFEDSFISHLSTIMPYHEIIAKTSC